MTVSTKGYVPSAALPAHVLDRADVRQALARHDFGCVFRLARKWGGISYSKIAESTGIKPERVGALARGEGAITTYAKIGEVADGLRIPGRLLGLTPRAWERRHHALAPVTISGTTPIPASRERNEVRLLLSHAAQVTMGLSLQQIGEEWAIPGADFTPPPGLVRVTDIEQIEHVTAGLRALDYQFGGGTCRDAVVAQTRWVTRLLRAQAPDDVRRRLHLALADLHNLTGWTSLDLGLYSASRHHFAHALTHARQADGPSLLANVLYRTGRLHLHRGMTSEALRFLQLGQIAAQDSGDARAVAVLCANEAWAYGMLGDPAQALRSLHRAADELARADTATLTPWVDFFGPTDLDAMNGMTHLELSTTDAGHLDPAIEALSRTVAARDTDQARSRAFEVTALAVATLRSNDRDAGWSLGWQAVTQAQQLRSRRVIDRLAPLALEAARITSPDGDQLAQAITSLQEA
ncbi:MAG: helix-turn-helix protein [Actinomycetota bacterium]|nr:helix-turn-helix protein [Actinomycetota bacterium]